jgi:F0F1-type ATP synthase assembly protein I
VEIAGLAIQSVLSPVISVVIGLWIDQKFDCSPWGIGVGGILGVAISAVLIRELTRRLKKSDDNIES